MNPIDFKKLPPLIRYRHLQSCGLGRKAIDALTIEVRRLDADVPDGRLGMLRLTKPRQMGAQKGQRYWRRLDVARVLGPQWM